MPSGRGCVLGMRVCVVIVEMWCGGVDVEG